MSDKKLINEMLLDLSTSKQIRNSVADLSEEDLMSGLEVQTEILNTWIKASKNMVNAQLFSKRTPIGTVISQNKRINSCYALKNSESEIRPALNQIILIYDEKFDEIISGVIENFKPLKSGSNETIIMVIDLLFIHQNAKLIKRKRVTQLISDECLVFDTTPEEVEKIFGIPDTGVKLGICSNNGDIIETKLGGPLYYLLKPELLKTHLMIGGVTGQSKTIFLKNMLYDLAVHDFNVSTNMTIFDLQGDLVQILEPMREELLDKNLKEIYKDGGISEFSGLKEKIINDDILFLKPFYIEPHGFLEMFPWINFGLSSIHITNSEDLTSIIPGLTKKGTQTLVQIFTLFMSERLENNVHFNFDEFFEFVNNGIQVDDKGKRSYLWGLQGQKDSIEATASVGDAMIRQLKVFKTLRVFDQVPEIDVGTLLNKRLVFIYFPDSPGYTQVRSVMLLDLLTRIYYAKRLNIDQAIKNNLIVIDEAHELLPKKQRGSDLSDDFFKFIEKRFTRIAKEGRKYGISLVISTQILSELNDEVKFNAQTRIFFKLSEKDLDSLNLDKDSIKLIDNLKKGYAVIYSRDNLEIGRSIEVKILPPVFLHCDPRTADKYFQSTVEEIIKERKKYEASIASKKT